MRTILISELRERSKSFTAGFLEAVISLGKITIETGAEKLEVTDALALMELTRQYRRRSRAWPSWAVRIKRAAIPSDRGVGDTIARLIGPVGGDAYKSWFKTTFGRACGCTERQASLNGQFPYA